MLTMARRKNLVIKIISTITLLTLCVTGCSVISQIESGFSGALSTTTPPPAIETLTPQLPATPQVTRQPLTLVLWVPPQFAPIEGNSAGMMLQERLQDFEESHPDLKVELRVKSTSGESSLLNSLAATAAAAPNALPGLILLNRSDMEVAALKSLIFPIASRTAEYSTADWFPFVEEIASTQGVQYGLPLFIDPFVMTYHANMITFPPSTWQEVTTQDAQMAVNLNNPRALFPYAMYLSAGGHLLDDEGNPTLETDALTRTYQILFNGSTSNAFPTWLTNQQAPEDAWNALLEKQVSYALVWTSQVLNSSNENIALAPLPGSATIPVGFVDGWLLCITSPTADHSRYDIMLADYLMESGFLAQWSETAGYIPAKRSVLLEWQNKSQARELELIADQSVVVPSNKIQQTTGVLLNQFSISLIRRQTSPMQAVIDTLAALEVK